MRPETNSENDILTPAPATLLAVSQIFIYRAYFQARFLSLNISDTYVPSDCVVSEFQGHPKGPCIGTHQLACTINVNFGLLTYLQVLNLLHLLLTLTGKLQNCLSRSPPHQMERAQKSRSYGASNKHCPCSNENSERPYSSLSPCYSDRYVSNSPKTCHVVSALTFIVNSMLSDIFSKKLRKKHFALLV